MRFSNGVVVSLDSLAAAPALSVKDAGVQVMPGLDDGPAVEPALLFPERDGGRMAVLDDQGLISADPWDPWFGA